MVRLVRACGSKLHTSVARGNGEMGQARKSLWIETTYVFCLTNIASVRLVRACGSKPYVITNRFIVIWVRLVRACGSKHSLQSEKMH